MADIQFPGGYFEGLPSTGHSHSMSLYNVGPAFVDIVLK